MSRMIKEGKYHGTKQLHSAPILVISSKLFVVTTYLIAGEELPLRTCLHTRYVPHVRTLYKRMCTMAVLPVPTGCFGNFTYNDAHRSLASDGTSCIASYSWNATLGRQPDNSPRLLHLVIKQLARLGPGPFNSPTVPLEDPRRNSLFFVKHHVVLQ